MTPKEKAYELVQKMRVHSPVWEIEGDAKECALIAVDEIFEALDEHHWENRNVTEYYREVKHEIEKL